MIPEDITVHKAHGMPFRQVRRTTSSLIIATTVLPGNIALYVCVLGSS